jgi:uncharacterized protein YdeI (YjbR/CyaY-like superfamily)
MQKNEIETFYPTSKAAWRQWLLDNHALKPSVWLVCYKKKSNTPTLSWSDAVDEALCFGWIDSIRKTVNDEKFIQFFSPRKPKGTWSKVNKEKIKVLIDNGLMTKAGLLSIEKAKQNGSWTILDEVEELIIPEDLLQAFIIKKGTKECFLSLSKSVRKAMLHRLIFAKRPETRQKRINEVMDLVSEKLKPKSF